MACSKNFFDDVKKELECSVCQEQFSDLREPKILKCLHTFCKSCLTAWLPRQQREGELSCPTCRRITQCSANDINKLPSNLFCKQLVEIVEAYSGQVGDEDSPHCGVCDEKKALKFYCIDCNCFLCGDCAGLHGKAKVFKGHDIKEISNFNSNDVQKYVRRANVCKKHEDEVRYYCEKCNICICRDCALLEHCDHKRFSLDHGLDLKKSVFTRRIEEVEDVGRRLQEQKANLEKQRTRFDTSVDQSKLEIHRVAENWMNVIRRHEEAMKKELLKRKETFENEFSAKMTDLNEKLTNIRNSLEFGRDILERNNLPEILNVEETLGRRFEDFLSSTEFSGSVELNTLSVKYVANDTFFSESELGKLVDPLMSIVRGKAAKKDETTYDEADQVDVDITSLLRTDETTKSLQSDLKDGWNVYNEQVITSVLQHKHKVDGVELTLKPSDEDIKAEVFEIVSAELCLEYAQSLSREEIKGVLLEIESKIGLRWIESYESFVISGTLRQVEEAHRVLIKGAYLVNGNEVVSDQEIKYEEAPQPQETGLSQANEERHEVMQRDVNQEPGEPPLEVASQASPCQAYLPDTREGISAPEKSLRCSLGLYCWHFNNYRASKSNNVERYSSQD
ncbi:transcription intermediary factor 1-alpha-like isoform X1 [Acropora muricata]|uniref:transcription intermediary factor 1-alpha-like isoform X1 n=1 Tax=Acropora muricata TaxID=159855 RepID=UPI0034E5E046